MELGQRTAITVNVSSHPEPRISWVVDGVVLRNHPQVIPKRSVGHHKYRGALQIPSVSMRMLAKETKVNVTNAKGSAEYIIKFNLLCAPEFRI